MLYSEILYDAFVILTEIVIIGMSESSAINLAILTVLPAFNGRYLQ